MQLPRQNSFPWCEIQHLLYHHQSSSRPGAHKANVLHCVTEKNSKFEKGCKNVKCRPAMKAMHWNIHEHINVGRTLNGAGDFVARDHKTCYDIDQQAANYILY